MRKIKALSLLLVLVLLSSVFAGCGLLFSPSSVTVTEEAEEIPAGQASTAYPVTIKDSVDREVTLEKKPEKLLSLGPNMTEIVFALGLGEQLVAVTDYCDYPAETAGIEKIGSLTEPDLEKIAELDPDLVLASTHVSEDTMAKLDELHIPVLMLYDEHKLDGLKGILETLGQALDVQPRAAELVTDVFSRIEAVRADLKEQEPVRGYYVVGFGEYGDYTAGGDTFAHEILEAAGIDNIAGDIQGWSYSLEKLLEEDPDIILIPLWAEGVFGTEEPYSELTAVKEGRVFAIDNNMIDRQGPRNADAVEAIAKVVHEALVPAP